MSTTVELNPSDIAGAIQRGLSELHAYLQQPALAVDTNSARDHLVRLDGLFQTLADMQAAYTSVANDKGNGEARAS